MPSKTQIDDHLAASYLNHFVAQAWKILEPATPFIANWHTDAICDHLTALLYGDISDLLINIPPRFTKSLIVSVMFPAFSWLDFPWMRFLASSYSDNLATRDSVKCRRIIQSPWYWRLWHERNKDQKDSAKREFYLVDDQNQKTRFENVHTGYRLATTVRGTNTGEGGNMILVDDPNNVKKAESDVDRNETNTWWKEVMSTRGDNYKKTGRAVIQQRTHENDLTGFILAEDLGYEHLCLPMEYEKKYHCVTSIFEDPRTEEGELLCEERFDREDVDKLKKTLGPYAAAGQLQQTPHPRGGGMFEENNFKKVNRPSARIVSSVRYWDKAGTEGGGAFTVGTLMHKLADGSCCIADIVRRQHASSKREALIKSTAEIDGVGVTIWMEQEPGSSGKDSVESSIKGLIGYTAKADRVTGSKVVRAEPYASQVEAKNVEVLVKDWTRDFINEHKSFPVGKYKDQVDATSGAFAKLFAKKKRSGVW